MGFPRAPRKRVSGNLKLYISPPASSVIGEEDSRPETEDLSSRLKFKVPRGFIMDTDLSEIIRRQEKGALTRLEELRKKVRGCCHSRVDSVVVNRAQEIVERACGILRDLVCDSPSLVVGHQKDTSITINLTVQDRLLAIVVYRNRIELGRYFKGTLTEESEVRKVSPPVIDSLSWVAGG